MRETGDRAIRQVQRLGCQVDCHLEPDLRRQVNEQPVMRLGIDDHRQQAVLQGVVAKNIGERGADDGPDAPTGQRPGGVLAGRAAAEVIASQQNLAARYAGLVERKIRVGAAIRQVAPA